MRLTRKYIYIDINLNNCKVNLPSLQFLGLNSLVLKIYFQFWKLYSLVKQTQIIYTFKDVQDAKTYAFDTIYVLVQIENRL